MLKKVRSLYVINCFWLLNRVLNVGEIVLKASLNKHHQNNPIQPPSWVSAAVTSLHKQWHEGLGWGQVQTSVASLCPSWQKFPSQEYSIKISQSETIGSSSKPIRGNIFLHLYKGAWNRKVKPFSLRFLCDGRVWKRCKNIFGKN